MRRATTILGRRTATGSANSQCCFASTAAKLKEPPPSEPSPSPSTTSSKWTRPVFPESPRQKEHVPSQNLSKWARPPSDLSSKAETSRSSPKLGSVEAGQGSGSARLGKWARPESVLESSLGSQTGGPSKTRRQSMNSRETDSSRDRIDGDSSRTRGWVSFNTLDQRSAARIPRGYVPSEGRAEGVGLSRRSSRASPHLDRDPAPHKAGAVRGIPQGPPVSEDIDDNDGISEPVSDDFYSDAEEEIRGTRASRVARENRKSRGSLLAHLSEEDAAIPSHSRHGGTQQEADMAKRKKRKIGSKQVTKKILVDLFVPSVVSVGTLARLLNVRIGTLQRKMVEAGMATEATPDHMLTADYASLLVMEFGRNPVVNDEAAFDIYPSPPHPEPATLPLRPPVVTIMGHVDHGKTTLLDTLRSSSVAKSEAGGITQHIGAFSVPVGPDRTVTFLDTPGHAAFSAMRARGAMVTDIIVLVVAADDGVMPQTREVIELIKKERDSVGVVVAVNKVDKPQANFERTCNALAAEGLQLETVGGDIPVVQVSGLTGKGLPDLVETISTVAELQDLRAEVDGKVHGYILESKIHKGLGPVATVLVSRGTLTGGTHLISGRSHAKVRVLQSTSGSSVKSASPGTAVVVSGWKELPNAGDDVLSGSEDDVKKAVANRIRKAEIESSLVDLEVINEHRRHEREERGLEEQGLDPTVQNDKQGPKELRLVIKADVSGSVEAVVGAISGIGNDKAAVKVVCTGVGDVTESDVMRAKAVEGMVVAFSVNIPRPIQAIATQNQVPIYSTTIIYRLVDDIKERLVALLPATIEAKVTGEATVLQIFDIQVKSKHVQKVAGCRVTDGVIEKGKKARIIRNGKIISEAPLETLRVLQRDVTEVRKGSECGMGLQGFGDVQRDDIIQVIQEVERPGEL